MTETDLKHIEELQERVLDGEQGLKKVMLTTASGILTAVILASAAGIWATNNQLKDIQGWQDTHDAHYDHGMAEMNKLDGRIGKLEAFADTGKRFTRDDGDKIEARVRLLENTSIRIETKLDAILNKLSAVKRQTGAP
jgi:hypothetical protein